MKVHQIASIVALALVLPTSADAQTPGSTAPPGSAAVDQYRESVPPAGSGARKLTDRERKRLADQGADGRALAEALERNGGLPAAEASGSSPANDPGDGARSSAGDQRIPRRGAAGPSATSTDAAGPGSASGGGGAAVGNETLARSSASSTVGPFPVWAMIVAAFALVGVAAVVRRRSA